MKNGSDLDVIVDTISLESKRLLIGPKYKDQGQNKNDLKTSSLHGNKSESGAKDVISFTPWPWSDPFHISFMIQDHFIYEPDLGKDGETIIVAASKMGWAMVISQQSSLLNLVAF